MYGRNWLGILYYLFNCFLLLIPVFIWNLALAKALPPAYQKKNWDNVPKPLTIAENVLRTFVFVSCVLLQLEIKERIQSIGLTIYISGLVLYFASWILQIRFAQIRSMQGILAFAAPAYTSFIWLYGIGLIGQRLLVDVAYSYWIYVLLSLAFVAVHTSHSIVAFRNWNRLNSSSSESGG
jgi:hypothetical protein